MLLPLMMCAKIRASPARCSHEDAGTTPSFTSRYAGRLPEWLLDRAATLGYIAPTKVQAEALDAVLEGNDAIIQAKTGSGKTLAYMLPLLALLQPKSSVQALVPRVEEAKARQRERQRP